MLNIDYEHNLEILLLLKNDMWNIKKKIDLQSKPKFTMKNLSVKLEIEKGIKENNSDLIKH